MARTGAYRRVPRFDALDAMHLALTLVMAGLGGVLVAPGDTFSTGRAWRLFVALHLSETDVGLLLLTVAAIGVLGMMPMGWLVRRVSILSLAGSHGALSAIFFLGNPIGGAPVPYLVLAGLGLYAVAREASDSR